MTDDTTAIPSDLAAERAVLGAMLLTTNAIDAVAGIVKAHDFYRPAHELIYSGILDLYGRGEVVDPVTVDGYLRAKGDQYGGTTYIHDLYGGVFTGEGAAHYARLVAEKAVLRRIIEASSRAIHAARQGVGDVEDIANAAQADLFAATNKANAEDYKPIGDIVGIAIDEIEAASHAGGAMTGVPTGFIDLDRLTNGLHPGQMIVVAGRPAMGKSTMAVDVARNASIKHGLASVIFSLEMGAPELTTRILSAEATVPLQNLRKGIVDDHQWTKLSRVMQPIADAPLYIDDSPNMTMPEIRAKARRLKQTHDLKLVIIDYLQLMTSGKRVESRQQEVSEFSRGIKLLAKELEVAVIVLSQLNRGPEQRTDKRPMVSDLRESGAVEQDADMVILVHREDVYDKESPRAGEADFIVGKHRNGPTDTIVVAFQGHYSRFVDMAR